MLILTRKAGQSFYIGDGVKVTIVEVKGNQIRVGIDAPKELRIYREEIYRQIIEENQSAAALDSAELGAGLESLSAAWGKRQDGAAFGPKVGALAATGSSSLVGVNAAGAGFRESEAKDRASTEAGVVVTKKRSKKNDE